MSVEIGRRAALAGGGAMLALGGRVPGLGGGAAQATQMDQAAQVAERQGNASMAFDVRRGGSSIGTHRLVFTRPAPGRLAVAIDIDLKVTFGPFTLYRYTHRNRTTWDGGRILSLATDTDDDGETHRVRAERDGAGHLAVTADGATQTVAGDIWPTTYWPADTVGRQRLLNTQTGAVAEVAVAEQGTRPQQTPEGEVTARGYAVSGDLDLKVWYDGKGRWVGLTFDAQGAEIAYHLTERRGAIPTAPPRSGPPRSGSAAADDGAI